MLKGVLLLPQELSMAPCHLPEPTTSLLRQGLPLAVVGPSEAREACSVVSASYSVHGTNPAFSEEFK